MAGPTEQTYTLVAADVGADITCTVTGTNSQGSVQATSAGTGAILAAAPANTVAPTLDDTTPEVAQTLTVNPGTWTGLATITYDYQWRRNGSPSPDNTGTTTYLVRGDDIGATISCEVTATNSYGQTVATTAESTAVPTPQFPYIEGVPTTRAETANTTTVNIDIPAHANNDMLLLALAHDGNVSFNSIDNVGGVAWQLLKAQSMSNSRYRVHWLRATSSGSASTITATLSGAERAASIVHRVPNAHTTAAPEITATAATAANKNPDPPALTPTWGSAKTLWVALYVNQVAPAGSPTAYPTGYSNTSYVTSTGGAEGVGLATAARQFEGSSENPGTFTLPFNETWYAETIAIRPA